MIHAVRWKRPAQRGVEQVTRKRPRKAEHGDLDAARLFVCCVFGQRSLSLSDGLADRLNTEVSDRLIRHQVGPKIRVDVQRPDTGLKFHGRTNEVGPILTLQRQFGDFGKGICRKGHDCSLSKFFGPTHAGNIDARAAYHQYNARYTSFVYLKLT
jgi:hypothetical protein